MTAFRMPSLGADMDDGTLVQWLKKPGDRLSRGDIIAVVETQKGAIEIEVFVDGVLQEAHVTPGTKVPVGELLATIRTIGEQSEAAPPVPLPPAPTAPPEASVSATPVMTVAGKKITPVARHQAKERAIDLGSVQPGPDGIIGLREISAPFPAAAQTKAGGINLDEMRKAIGVAMARSKRQIPHYYVASTIDMTAPMAWLSKENTGRAAPDRILSPALIIKACALSLRQFGPLNGHFLESGFEHHDKIKMGIGIALRGGGLIAPAMPAPDALPLGDIMHKLSDLVARVRGGRLRSSELTEATVTVSNLGDDSSDSVLPIIYPPQVAIIGVGQIAERPWVVGGSVAVRKVATFTVAGDHRVSDGRVAARFLRHLEQLLMKPEEL